MDETRDPPEIGDFGFHYPFDSVRLCVTILKASQFQSWPDKGGLLDQDAFWISDIMTWLRIERRLEWERDADGETDGEGPDRAIEDLHFG